MNNPRSSESEGQLNKSKSATGAEKITESIKYGLVWVGAYMLFSGHRAGSKFIDDAHKCEQQVNETRTAMEQAGISFKDNGAIDFSIPVKKPLTDEEIVPLWRKSLDVINKCDQLYMPNPAAPTIFWGKFDINKFINNTQPAMKSHWAWNLGAGTLTLKPQITEQPSSSSSTNAISSAKPTVKIQNTNSGEQQNPGMQKLSFPKLESKKKPNVEVQEPVGGRGRAGEPPKKPDVERSIESGPRGKSINDY